MMMGFGWAGLIIMFLFWCLLVAGAIWLVKSIFPGDMRGNEPGDLGHMTARQILDHRYARGELSREHYLAMVDDVSNVREE